MFGIGSGSTVTFRERCNKMSDLSLTIADDGPLSDDAVRALAVLLVDLAEAEVAGDPQESKAPARDRAGPV